MTSASIQSSTRNECLEYPGQVTATTWLSCQPQSRQQSDGGRWAGGEVSSANRPNDAQRQRPVEDPDPVLHRHSGQAEPRSCHRHHVRPIGDRILLPRSYLEPLQRHVSLAIHPSRHRHVAVIDRLDIGARAPPRSCAYQSIRECKYASVGCRKELVTLELVDSMSTVVNSDETRPLTPSRRG